jgi:hypothetical protein
MKIINTTIILILLLSLSSFGQSKFNEKKIGHIYYVSVPDYMIETDQLNDVASLQFQNTIKEAYVIVIEDSKKSLTKAGMGFSGPREFYDGFAKDFFNAEDEIGNIKDIKVNGNDAVQVEVKRKFNELDIIYLVTVIETQSHFYKMLSWTLAGNWDSLVDDFKKIAASLHD